MSFSQDMADALDSYPADSVTLEITDVAIQNGERTISAMSYVVVTLAVLAAFLIATAAVYRAVVYRAGVRGPRRYRAPVGGPLDRDVERQLEELRALGGSGDLVGYRH